MSKKTLFSILGTVALCSLSGCGENRLIDRSLVFATHTTMGLELSVSPAETSGPVNMVLGYKRTEGVINPVYHSEGIETPDQEIHTAPEAGTTSVTTTGRRPRYRDESYSVIAKFAGETGGSADKITSAGMSVAQCFATGEAAKTIAGQPGIAGAVTGSSEIAEAAARESTASLKGESRTVSIAILSLIKTGLDEFQKDEGLSPEIRSQARHHVEKLDSLAAHLPERYTFTRYEHPGPGKNYNSVRSKQEGKPVERDGFDDVIIYLGHIDDSIRIHGEMLAVDGLQVDGSQPADLKQQIIKHRDSANKAKDEMKAVERDPVSIEAVDFYFNVVFGR